MTHFNYDVAFGRNLGIVSAAEQTRLRKSRVALAGLGGAGGGYAQALARLGVGHFSLADGDTFETANFNRQMGGLLSTVGCNKARSLEKQIHAVNPEAVVDVWEEHLDEHNIAAFLSGADLVLDGIEVFAISAHQLLLQKAREHGLPVFFGIPPAFSTGVLIFDPHGMSAEKYFDWRPNQDETEQVLGLILGSAPSLLYYNMIDTRYMDFDRQVGPSHIGACLLCAGVMACEATRLLLGRPGCRYVPECLQFDPYTGRMKRVRLRWGLRGPWIRLKRQLITRRLRRRGFGRAAIEKSVRASSARGAASRVSSV